MADIDDVELYWQNDQLDVDVVFRPGRDTFFFPSNFNNFEIGSMPENLILTDEEQDNEYSPPLHPTNPVSVTTTQPPVLMRSQPFGTRNENVPDYVYRNSFE